MFRQGMFIMLALLAMPAGAEIYKWTDAQGKVHYGDHPPSHTSPEQFVPKVSEAAEARALDARRRMADEAARKRIEDVKQREAEAREQATKAEEAQRKAENCGRARRNLELLQRANMRLSAVDAQGNTRVLDVATRQAEIERAQQMMRENCAN